MGWMRAFWIHSAILFLIFKQSTSLECYNCFTTNETNSLKTSELVPCNDDLETSNTWICPNEIFECAYMKVKVQDSTEILRTCVTDITECKDIYPNGEILDCLICDTDLCNGQTDSEPEEPDTPDNSTCSPFNIAVNLNINLNILEHF